MSEQQKHLNCTHLGVNLGQYLFHRVWKDCFPALLRFYQRHDNCCLTTSTPSLAPPLKNLRDIRTSHLLCERYKFLNGRLNCFSHTSSQKRDFITLARWDEHHQNMGMSQLMFWAVFSKKTHTVPKMFNSKSLRSQILHGYSLHCEQKESHACVAAFSKETHFWTMCIFLQLCRTDPSSLKPN